MRPLRNTSPSAANEAGSAPARLNNSSRTERVWAGRWRVTRIEAGNLAGRFFARKISASTPPAEVPMATISRLAIQCLLSGMPIAETARKRGGSRQGVTSKGGPNAFTGSWFQPPANQFIRNWRRRSTYSLHHWQRTQAPVAERPSRSRLPSGAHDGPGPYPSESSGRGRADRAASRAERGYDRGAAQASCLAGEAGARFSAFDGAPRNVPARPRIPYRAS